MTAETWKAIISSDSVFPVEADLGDKCFLFNHRTDRLTNLVFVFGSDITALRKAEREIREIARFPDMNPGPVIRMNTEGFVLLDNAAAKKIFGQDIKGKCWLDIWPQLRDGIWDKIISSAAVTPVEVQMDDSIFVFNHRRDMLTNLVFVYGTDITFQKNAERKLAQSEKMATLGTLAAGIAHELNNPAAAAGSAASQLRDLINKSERWRNSMFMHAHTEEEFGLISSFSNLAVERSAKPVKMKLVELSQKENDMEDWLIGQGIAGAHQYASIIVSLGHSPDSLQELSSGYNKEFFFNALILASYTFQVNSLLNEVGESSRRISEIVRAMKSYSFLDQAPVQKVDVHEGIDNTLIILRSKLSGITVNLEYGDIPPVTAYGSELNQVWTNILDNAIGALKGAGEITVRTHADKNAITVEIEDNCPGIPKEIQSRIFDPFFTTKEPGKGTGLGLSTTYGIITEKHGGTIRLTSVPGKTVFTVTLPVGK